MSKRFIITLITLLVIGLAALAAVFLAKGFTFSSTEKRMVGTGLISVTSIPDGASVYIDGHLATATNTTISSLSPKKYNIKIIKEGFIPWEKEMEVKEGIVTEIKATLFPALPTIYPLTYNGVLKPVLSPDGQKLAFTVPIQESSAHARQRGGVWVWTMTSQPISLNRGAEPHQLVMSTNTLDFSKANLKWSPDSKQLLVTLYENGTESEANLRNYLLNADNYSSLDSLKDTTPLISSTLKGWEDDQKTKDDAKVAAIKNMQIRQEASSSAMLKWSPDESKIMVGEIAQTISQKQKLASNSAEVQYKNVKVIDIPYLKTYTLPEALAYYWLPDSRHIILVQEDKVSICEYDGLNVSVIYAGKFEDSEVFPWPDSSKLVLVTAFNTPTASTPNLFGINLK